MVEVIENVTDRLQTTPANLEQTRALMEIRDKGLYRDVLGYQTFEEYCRVKWDFASNYARRLMSSAETVENIKAVPMGTFPSNERQARPLARLEPEKQAYQDRVMDALARYEKTRSRKTGTGRKGKS